MWRAFTYIFIPICAVGVAVLLWIIVGDLGEGDFKGACIALLFVTWWSWAGVSAYVSNIKQPREERKRLCLETEEILSKTIASGLTLGVAVKAVKELFPIEGEPRYRDGPTLAYDTTVELETRAFTILLFGKNGIVQSWSVQ